MTPETRIIRQRQIEERKRTRKSDEPLRCYLNLKPYRDKRGIACRRSLTSCCMKKYKGYPCELTSQPRGIPITT